MFFGILADMTGTSFRTYLQVASYNDLMMRIRDDFPPISHYKFRISHNRILIENDPSLHDGDEIALLPPFYGG